MSSPTVLFALTSHDQLGDSGRRTGAYAPEFAHPARVFRDAGYDIAFVSTNGGPVPLDGLKPDDTVTGDFLAEPEIAAALQNSVTADGLDPRDYAVIFYAGGHGTMWDFPETAALADLASRIHDRGGVVAAVCHGPSGLVKVRREDGELLIKDRRVSCFTNSEERAVGLAETVPFLLQDELTRLGARHEGGPNFAEYAVRDDRLVTGQNPASATAVARLTLEALEATADDTAEVAAR